MRLILIVAVLLTLCACSGLSDEQLEKSGNRIQKRIDESLERHGRNALEALKEAGGELADGKRLVITIELEDKPE